MTQYREVKRRANVGERIKIVAAEDTFDQYENGDEFVVDRAEGRCVEVDAVGGVAGNFDGAIMSREYVVLEPITASETPKTVTIDEFRELQRKVADLETQLRVAREDIVLIEEGASADIIRLEAAAFPSKWRR